MRLSFIRIISFRGIGDLSLDLSELTLLIGENGCSKGAVIDAITLCLAPTSPNAPRFAAGDFPRRGGGDPHVRLTFVETRPDETIDARFAIAKDRARCIASGGGRGMRNPARIARRDQKLDVDAFERFGVGVVDDSSHRREGSD